MFDHDNCEGTGTCRNIPGHWVLCFGLSDEKYDSATWVQVCGFHLPLVNGWVTSTANPKALRLYRARHQAA